MPDIPELLYRHKLSIYDQKRNDPNAGAVSDLSPYLHFGQILAQRIAFEISSKSFVDDNAAIIHEELIIRRELPDNFYHYNPHYDSFDGFSD